MISTLVRLPDEGADEVEDDAFGTYYNVVMDII